MAYLIGKLLGAILCAVLAAFFAALILQIAVKVVAKVKLQYREACVFTLIAFLATLGFGVGLYFLLQLKSGSHDLESDIVSEVSAWGWSFVFGLLAQTYVYGTRIKHPDTGPIGLGKGIVVCGITTVAFAALAFLTIWLLSRG